VLSLKRRAVEERGGRGERGVASYSGLKQKEDYQEPHFIQKKRGRFLLSIRKRRLRHPFLLTTE